MVNENDLGPRNAQVCYYLLATVFAKGLRIREGGFKHPSLSLGKVIVVDQPDASGEVLARLPSVTLVRVAAPLDTVLDHALAHLGVITSE